MKDDKIKKCLIAGYDMNIISQEELNEYWNYITNLQEENERLNTRNKILAEDITKDRINCEVIQTVCGIPIEEIPELKLYKSRNEKAIEYIKEHNIISVNKEYIPNNVIATYDIGLVNILQGDDKDDK